MRTPADISHPVPSVPAPEQKGGRALPLPPGTRLYKLVLKVVRQRTYLVKHDLSHLPYAEVRPALMKLQTWLDQNPHAGPLAIARFNLGAELRYLIPTNDAGKSLRAELDQLITL